MKKIDKMLDKKAQEANSHSEGECKKCESCKCKTTELLDLPKKETKEIHEGDDQIIKPSMGVLPDKKA